MGPVMVSHRKVFTYPGVFKLFNELMKLRVDGVGDKVPEFCALSSSKVTVKEVIKSLGSLRFLFDNKATIQITQASHFGDKSGSETDD